MAINETNTKPEDVLRALVDLIEEIRVRRQAEAAECLHTELKTFSQRELTDVACPSYKNYLLGRSTRLPLREMVIQIAEYLECTPAERDDLLMCAGYLPESFALREDEYRSAVKRACLLATMLPLPAVIIGRNGQTLHTNPAIYTKIGRPVLDQWRPETRNLISYFFDPRLGISQHYAVTPEDWRCAADSAAVLLYLTNSPRLRETSFRRMLSAARALPDFAAAWDRVVASPPSVFTSGCEMRMQTAFMDQPIVELNMLIPITAGLEVSMVVGVPVDDAARFAYAHIGCEVDGTRWETMLKDFSAV